MQHLNPMQWLGFYAVYFSIKYLSPDKTYSYHPVMQSQVYQVEKPNSRPNEGSNSCVGHFYIVWKSGHSWQLPGESSEVC